MSSKERVGSRIRQVRTQQAKTLRDVESASGFSSTHISEIERGRTCPTIGALIQIAQALDKDPSFFIEERELDEVCVTSRDERPMPEASILHVKGTGILLESLTGGILGGRLQAFEFRLEPGAEGSIVDLPEAIDACIYCLAGGLEITLSERALQLASGSSTHTTVDGTIELRNPGREAGRCLIILDPETVIP
ncbi:MAG: helix-turn-helix transcriptional regulator [Candidatus Eisenbacteria bacterium]|nr:helix-turn-helix transcriptional regulator [Candidatus Eisenbacteria bacterium]